MSASTTVTQRHLTNWLTRRIPLAGARRVSPVSGALATDSGLVREDNQDRVAVIRSRDRAGQTFVVAALADGIGGMRDGALCASIAIGHFFGKLAEIAQASDEIDRWLALAVNHANDAVFSSFRGAGGSTLVSLLIHESGAVYWSSVGDSRVYLGVDATLKQLSTDDTIAGQLGRPADPAYEQSKLLQFIGIGEALEVHVGDIVPSDGAKVLLTSDGVHYLASGSDWLSSIVAHSPDAGTCVRRLIDVSKWCGGPDNASAIAMPLEVDFSSDPAPFEPCIEVWDSFGEMRLLIEEIAVPSHARRDERPGPENEISPDLIGHSQSVDAERTKKKKERAGQKSKTKAKVKTAIGEHGAHNDADTEEGQVQLEFRSKS